MEEVSYLTQEGLDRLRNKLKDMKSKGRAEISRALAEARDKGDLSENAEYDAAKDAQALFELKISKLQKTIARSRVIDKSQVDTSKASILSRLKIRKTEDGSELLYQLVSEEESDIRQGKISVKSPIGRALVGKNPGDKVVVEVPAGRIEYEILSIDFD